MTKTDATQRALDDLDDAVNYKKTDAYYEKLRHYILKHEQTIRTALETAQKHKDFIDALPEETTAIGIDNAPTRSDNEVIREVVELLMCIQKNLEIDKFDIAELCTEQALEKLKELEGRDV